MSAPTTSTVNGASSAPSAPSSKESGISSTDVGWQFVPQYYNFVNKHPQRLHCFYTKQSTFIHGTEGEDGVHSSGQQDIHQKILSIGFKDCKVFIHSVDSQPSANGGIIIQVIGEMFNDEGPWRKFVQTFFLAEQPNGYFVLNDIFRFLKEDTVADDEETAASETAASASVEAPKAEVAAPPAAPAAEEQKEEVAAVAEPTPVAAPVEEKAAPAVVEEKKETPAPDAASAIEEKTSDPTPEIESSDPVVETTPAPVVAEKAVAPAPALPAPVPTPAAPSPAPPAPAAPPAPKTWASLAKSSAGGWGNHLAAAAQGVSSAAASAVSVAKEVAAPVAPKPAGGSKEGGANGRAAGGLHPAAEAANNVTTAQCFVKLANWAADRETALDAELLKSVLEARFGKVKELEIVKQKACAFLEFATVDSARKAILASLPTQHGGEGGIKVEDQGRVTIEVRKEKSERGNVPGGAGRPPRPERTESAGGAPRGGGAGRGRGGGEGGRGGRGGARGGRGGAAASSAPAAK